MLIAYIDPKTREVRVLSTDENPAVVVLSVQEENAVWLAKEQHGSKGGMRCHVFYDRFQAPTMRDAAHAAQVQNKLVAALENHPDFRGYLAGLLNPVLATQEVALQNLNPKGG